VQLTLVGVNAGHGVPWSYCSKRNVLSDCLNWLCDKTGCLISDGKLFQSWGCSVAKQTLHQWPVF